MATIWDKLKTKTYEIISNIGFNIPLILGNDFKTTDDLDILLNKISSAFVSGTLTVVDTNYKATNQEIPIRITNPNPLTDYRSLFFRYYYIIKKYGVARLYVRDNSYYLLEEENSSYTYKNVGVLSLTDFSDVYDTFRYNSGGKSVDLLKDGGKIVTIFDIGFDQTYFTPIKRISQVGKTINLNATALESLTGSYKTTSLLMLYPKGEQTASGILRANQINTDKKRKEGAEEFVKDYSIKNGSVAMLPREVGKVDTTPDIKKLNGIETRNHTLERLCAQFEYPYKMLIGETKYDDLKSVITYFYTETLQSEADKFLSILRKELKIKELVVMDYSKNLEIFDSKEDNNETTTTE